MAQQQKSIALKNQLQFVRPEAQIDHCATASLDFYHKFYSESRPICQIKDRFKSES